MSQFELKLPAYEGPLEKLLELIEARSLDVTEVSLAVVTDDFLKYLESLEDVPAALLADFIVVASRLILIKSKSLLPSLPLTEEEERDMHDLESRLLLYQKLKGTQKYVESSWKSGAVSYDRPYFMELGAASVFYPGNNVTPLNLKEAMLSLHENLKKYTLEVETIRETVVSIEEKMRDVVTRMESYAEMSLKALAKGQSRSEVIVAFLAILHLAREQLVRLEQIGQFSDIIIRKTEPLAADTEGKTALDDING